MLAILNLTIQKGEAINRQLPPLSRSVTLLPLVPDELSNSEVRFWGRLLEHRAKVKLGRWAVCLETSSEIQLKAGGPPRFMAHVKIC